jgi:excisionase family DNA binding protein
MNDQNHSSVSSYQYGNNPNLNDEDQKKTGRANDARKLDVNNLPDLLTVREVADLLRVSPLTIKRWGKRGKLPAIRINSRGDRRYKKEAVLWLLGINAGAEEGAE